MWLCGVTAPNNRNALGRCWHTHPKRDALSSVNHYQQGQSRAAKGNTYTHPKTTRNTKRRHVLRRRSSCWSDMFYVRTYIYILCRSEVLISNDRNDHPPRVRSFISDYNREDKATAPPATSFSYWLSGQKLDIERKLLGILHVLRLETSRNVCSM